MRDAEDVEVVGRQQFPFTSGEPALTRLRLALGAMPVTAGVVGDGLLAARRTSIEMAAQRCRATVLDGAKCFEFLVSETRLILAERRLPWARRMSATSTTGRLIPSCDDTRG